MTRWHGKTTLSSPVNAVDKRPLEAELDELGLNLPCGADSQMNCREWREATLFQEFLNRLGTTLTNRARSSPWQKSGKQRQTSDIK